MGVLMAVILVATMVGLVYLTQTLGTNATSSEISNLTDKSNDLRDLVNSHTYAVEVGTDPEKVAKAARKLGLERLGDPVILPAR